MSASSSCGLVSGRAYERGGHLARVGTVLAWYDARRGLGGGQWHGERDHGSSKGRCVRDHWRTFGGETRVRLGPSTVILIWDYGVYYYGRDYGARARLWSKIHLKYGIGAVIT